MQQKVVIVAGKRTPIGSFQGQFSSISASDLGSNVVKKLMHDFQINPNQIEEIIFGNVLSAGQGQAPARQVAIKSGCPNTIESLTINKMCGSGLKAVMLAEQIIRCGDADTIIAGGMESMTNAPYILKDARLGHRLGHGKLIDSMIHDGLWDAYNNLHMGNCAEMLAKERNYTRDAQDKYAIESYNRTISAIKNKIFAPEIVPIEVMKRKNDSLIIEDDEEPGRVKFEKISKIGPAFEENGTITAANASKLNDGAAALLIMSEKKARKLNIKPIATILGHASAAHEPEWFTTAPSKVISKLLNKLQLVSSDIDLWEINEAFSVVAMAAMDDFQIDHKKVNIYGGAIAMGHPIGASGARILTTLLNGMSQTKARLGLAALCIGGGEASALVIERYD